MYINTLCFRKKIVFMDINSYVFHSHICTTYVRTFTYIKSYVVSAICKYATWWNGAIAYGRIYIVEEFLLRNIYKPFTYCELGYTYEQKQKIVCFIYVYSNHPKYIHNSLAGCCVYQQSKIKKNLLSSIYYCEENRWENEKIYEKIARHTHIRAPRRRRVNARKLYLYIKNPSYNTKHNTKQKS